MKNRIQHLFVFCLWAGSLFPVGAQITSQANPKNPPAKNILILYSDDQSFRTMRALGNTEIKTPHLDRLVKMGLTFQQAHVMGGHQGAVCIPSRAMLLTGRYVNRLPGDGNVISDSLISLPEVLRQNGYTTFHTGKWHSDKISYARMFSKADNIFFGGMHFPKEGGQEHPRVNHFDPTGKYPVEKSFLSETYSSYLYAQTAIDFLSSREAKEKPFFAYVAFTSPHDPRTPTAKFAKAYDPSKISLPPNFLPEHPFNNGDLNVRDENLLPHPRTEKAIKEDIAAYYGMISELDEQIGRIMSTLEKEGLLKNTLIVFAGDNGLAMGQHGLLGKQNLYEHSIRVPMIFSGPGIPKNVRNNSFVYLSDITPTIYDYLKINAPKTVEAKSLSPILRNPSAAVREQIYNVYGHWSRSLKTKDGYKLILYNVDGVLTRQLFNLKTDPWEKHNLAQDKSQQRRILSMRERLKKEMLEKHDNLQIDLPDWGRTAGQKSSGS
jgi:arylsulfatase A-like enzyme